MNFMKLSEPWSTKEIFCFVRACNKLTFDLKKKHLKIRYGKI